MSGVRIKTNVESLVAQKHLSNSRRDLSESMEKLSKSYRKLGTKTRTTGGTLHATIDRQRARRSS